MKRKLVFTFILLLANTVCFAQARVPSEGRDFFVGLVCPSFFRVLPDVLYYYTPQYFASVVITSETKNSVDISYYDQSGTEVYSKLYTLSEGRNSLHFDTQMFSRGVHLLCVHSSRILINQPFIKQ